MQIVFARHLENVVFQPLKVDVLQLQQLNKEIEYYKRNKTVSLHLAIFTTASCNNSRIKVSTTVRIEEENNLMEIG